MSFRHTNPKSLIAQAMSLSEEERDSILGIEIRDDGSVRDHVEHVTYKSVDEWAKYTVDQDQGDGGQFSMRDHWD